jgi:DMSO/TMAO reductase YedYZ molybdopterin-dependent catalytic subunit
MLALTLVLAAATPQIHCTGHEANLATFLEMTKVLFNERQADRAGEFYAPEIINHNSDDGGFGTTTVPVERWGNYDMVTRVRQLGLDLDLSPLTLPARD